MEPQIIRTENGEELVILPRSVYDSLVKHRRGGEAAGAARIAKESRSAIASGRELVLPAKVAEAIARGESPIRVIREWRGMTQMQLGETKTGVGQSYLSQLECGKKRGSPAVLKTLAKALQVPVDLLIPE